MSANVPWMVPRPVNTLFTGRSKIVGKIKDTICYNGMAVTEEQQRFVITGLGGQGKSEVCLKVTDLVREKEGSLA